MEAVCSIIFNEDKTGVLLTKRRDIPVWVLPGGGIDSGETPEEAAIREVFEETGCRVVIVRKIAEYISVNQFTKPTHFFECKILFGSPQTGEETQEIAFFSLDNLPKHLAPPYRGWIADALLDTKEILRKKIEGVSYWVFVKLLLTHPILVGRYLLTKIGIHINR